MVRAPIVYYHLGCHQVESISMYTQAAERRTNMEKIQHMILR